jgi:hypothetical protein
MRDFVVSFTPRICVRCFPAFIVHLSRHLQKRWLKVLLQFHTVSTGPHCNRCTEGKNIVEK